jgi:hypothetical protein
LIPSFASSASSSMMNSRTRTPRLPHFTRTWWWGGGARCHLQTLDGVPDRHQVVDRFAKQLAHHTDQAVNNWTGHLVGPIRTPRRTPRTAGSPGRIMSFIFEPATGVTLTSATNTGKHGEWFREFLADRGIALGSHTPFARSLATLQRFAGLTAGDPQPQLTVREMYVLAADGIGTDFMTKAIHRTIARTAEPFTTFWPEFAVADAVQTRRGVDSQSRNRLWELLVGALVADFATDIGAEEPDLRCTFLGRRWGIACKSFYTQNRNRQVEAIVEGAKQLEGTPVDRGIVAVNLGNVFPHLETFRRNFGSSAEAMAYVYGVFNRFSSRFHHLVGDSRLTMCKDGTRDKTRCVLFFCPTIVNVGWRPALFSLIDMLDVRRIQHEERHLVLMFRKAAATAIDDPPPRVPGGAL